MVQLISVLVLIIVILAEIIAIIVLGRAGPKNNRPNYRGGPPCC
jgi:hypothetical protein